MKSGILRCGFVVVILTILVLTSVSDASAQLLLNEVESDAPNDQTEACSYVEILGSPGSVVPGGTFFFAVDGDIGVFGQLSFIKDLSGVKVGSNGTITLVTKDQPCAGRNYSGSTVVPVDTVLGLGQTAETYMLARAPAGTVFAETDDIDLDNNGVIDPKFKLRKIDAISYLTQRSATKAYGPVLAAGEVNVPNAATRFPGNTSPLNAAAWYYGELSGSSDNSTGYRAPLSSNFPVGGKLTPGAPNIGGSPNQGGQHLGRRQQ